MHMIWHGSSFEVQKDVVAREVLHPKGLHVCAFFWDDFVFDVMTIQPRLSLVVFVKSEIRSVAGHWHIVDHMRDWHIIFMREVGDDLAAEEIVINPSQRIDPPLLALQNLPVKLLRLIEVVGRHGVMERFVYDLVVHDMNIKMITASSHAGKCPYRPAPCLSIAASSCLPCNARAASSCGSNRRHST